MWTIQQFITAVRILLQDNTLPYRYPDDNIALGFDIAFDEAQRIRPDMFMKTTINPIVGQPVANPMPVPTGYKSAFIMYTSGWVQLQDNEDTDDQRATIFLNKFISQLMTPAS